MRSIKPGRGPSGMNAMGAVVAVIFGIFWTVMAVSMGAPFFFPLFGILFIIIGIVQAVYHTHNATSSNRFSSFDITEDGEEPDPLEQRFQKEEKNPYGETSSSEPVSFCPYCGTKVENGYEFCPKCGKKLP